jgi:hypothetical protein
MPLVLPHLTFFVDPSLVAALDFVRVALQVRDLFTTEHPHIPTLFCLHVASKTEAKWKRMSPISTANSRTPFLVSNGLQCDFCVDAVGNH